MTNYFGDGAVPQANLLGYPVYQFIITDPNDVGRNFYVAGFKDDGYSLNLQVVEDIKSGLITAGYSVYEVLRHGLAYDNIDDL